MKKLVLTFVALVAVATTSFAQDYELYRICSEVVHSYNAPSVPYSVPTVTYSIPSSVNYNTTSVSGYSRSNGTYVHPHVRTMPDYSSSAYNYGAGHTIHTGTRGGQYYYNSNGHKTYVPKRKLW